MEINYFEIMENSVFFDPNNEINKEFPFKVLILTSSHYDNFDLFFKGFANVEIISHNASQTNLIEFEKYDLVWIYGIT